MTTTESQATAESQPSQVTEDETKIATEQTHMEHNYRLMSIDELNKLLNDSEVSKNQKKKIKKQIKWFEDADARREQRKKRKIITKKQNAAKGIKRMKFDTKITTKENFEDLYHIAVDASFDDLMLNKDIKKLGKQIAWCYKENRRSQQPVQYHICGMAERLSSMLDPSYPNWDVHFDEKVFESFATESITYLTAESQNVLEELKPGTVYVIGGLVDHNHEKGLCHRLANENGVKSARLPLAENFDIKSRKVLTVNHVFEILLAFRETGDWKEAITKVLPTKKLTNQSRRSAKRNKNAENQNGSDKDDGSESEKGVEVSEYENLENKSVENQNGSDKEDGSESENGKVGERENFGNESVENESEPKSTEQSS